MKKSVRELKEVIEQLKRSIDTLVNRINKDETTNFVANYNQGLRFAIALYMADILAIETKIKLLENNQI